MSDQGSDNRLQVVKRLRRHSLGPDDFLAPMNGAQASLFPMPRPGLLIFVFFPDVTEEEFCKTLAFAKPSIVVELRNTPRFDIGGLNRQKVFRFFDEQQSKYLDLTSWQATKDYDSNLLEGIRGVFAETPSPFNKPIMFLLSSSTPQELPDRIIDVIAEIKRTPPEILEVPAFVSVDH